MNYSSYGHFTLIFRQDNGINVLNIFSCGYFGAKISYREITGHENVHTTNISTSTVCSKRGKNFNPFVK